ncbi:MAG: 5-methyltetrahydrofolate--homocysteine methyltransferase [Prevotellaceae bacterium]|jgi:5-methyltetrahydrofolate--homocysteine methyltransferase|nr:5-methyltetrahydrofolate--homocysteine methyltransferase [Prevotellaceae bacterium]
MKMLNPNHIGAQYLHIAISELVPLIDWRFFFMAWRLTGEKTAEKTAEIEKLKQDADKLLAQFIANDTLQINAFCGIYPAHSDNENIVFDNEDIVIPTLRQQHPSTDGFCYALADFLEDKTAKSPNFIGVFALTVLGAEDYAKQLESAGELYDAILVKTLADRLAEAAAEWLHYKVRTDIWGYAPDELFDAATLLRSQYQGIRPAIGYPSLPDQSVILDLDKLVNFNKLGITLTENGAMYPTASIAGLYFACPQSKYFLVGKIDELQLADYAARRKKPLAEMRKWLAANL